MPRIPTSATIGRRGIEIDGEPIPFAVLDDITVTPSPRGLHQIHVTIPVHGPVVCVDSESDRYKEWDGSALTELLSGDDPTDRYPTRER